MDQVRIEEKGAVFAVVMDHQGETQEMDVRSTYLDAAEFACYLAGVLHVDAYYHGQKV